MTTTTTADCRHTMLAHLCQQQHATHILSYAIHTRVGVCEQQPRSVLFIPLVDGRPTTMD